MDGVIHGLVAIALFIIVLGGLVLVHELGHFLTARALNVRVLEFGIGIPPRAKVLRSKGETLVSLNWLPIGGFVRLDGEDGDAADDPRAFSAKPLTHRLLILVAGVAMNILFAFVLFLGIAWLATPVTGIKIGQIEAGSPAASVGLRPGDRIYAVNGERFEFFGNRTVVDALRGNAGKSVAIEVTQPDGSTHMISVTLRPAADTSQTRGALGVGKLEQAYSGDYVGHDFGVAVGIAAEQVTRSGGLILTGLGDLVSGFIDDPTAPPAAAGPIGIATSLADIFLGSGLVLTIYFAALLSVNLGVVNVLPIPPFDGGRMAVLVIRRLLGARISLRAERVTFAIGFVFVFALLLWVSGFDIVGQGATP